MDKDEQKLVPNPFFADEDKLDPQIPTGTLQIYKFIAEALERKPDTHVNRASSASVCYKRRWLQRNGHTGTPLTPRKIVNFTLGDLAERVVVYFIKEGLVGPGKLYSEVSFGKETGSVKIQGKNIPIHEQEELTANIGGINVTAHVDGFGKRNSDGQFELIEIKSAAEYGFDEFRKVGPGNYLNQAHVNMRNNKAIELGVNSVRFFYLLKSTGHIYDRLFFFDQKIMDRVIEEYRIVNADSEPERPYSPLEDEEIGQGRGKKKLKTGRQVIGFPCNFCSFTAYCYPKMTIEWADGRTGFKIPKYVVKNEEN